jgi:DNA-binding PadR family transcriptional regulator
MPRNRRSNALALAVLVCLLERPMHPYEMATTMRTRGKHESIRLNYGSLYGVVQSLERSRLIERQETEREGRRPERTVYRLTDTGRVECLDWLSELLSTPVKEYTQFEAGLSLLAAVPPEDALRLLEERAQRIEMRLAAERSQRDYATREAHLPRLFAIEAEYTIALQEAELAWVNGLVEEIRSGSLEGLAWWSEAHRSGMLASGERRDEPEPE